MVTTRSTTSIALAAATLFVVPASSAFATTPATGPRTSAEVGAAPVPAAPGDLAVASATVDAGGGMTGPGALTIIGTATNSVSRIIKLGTFPVALAVSSSGSTAYVAGVGGDEDGEPGTLWPVNIATGSVGMAVNVGTDPTAVALAPNGLTAYVACSYDAATEAPTGSVRLVSTTTDKAGKVVKVAAGPTAITFTPNGQMAFALGANAITPIATVTGSARPSIKLQAGAVAITPDSQTAYFVGHTVPGPLEVFPVSTTSGSYKKPVSTGASVPQADAVSPNGQAVYVVGTPDPGLGAKDDTVSVISTAMNRVTKTIDLGDYPGDNAWQVAVSPDGKTVYALAYGTPAHTGMIVPIDTVTDRAAKPIPVGGDAASVVFSASSKWAYVLDDGYRSSASRSAGAVVTINVASGMVAKVIPVAAYADALAES